MRAWVFCEYANVPPQSKKHLFLANFDTELNVGESVRMHGCSSHLSLGWPCDGLDTCPGCTLPLARGDLKTELFYECTY